MTATERLTVAYDSQDVRGPHLHPLRAAQRSQLHELHVLRGSPGDPAAGCPRRGSGPSPAPPRHADAGASGAAARRVPDRCGAPGGGRRARTRGGDDRQLQGDRLAGAAALVGGGTHLPGAPAPGHCGGPGDPTRLPRPLLAGLRPGRHQGPGARPHRAAERAADPRRSRRRADAPAGREAAAAQAQLPQPHSDAATQAGPGGGRLPDALFVGGAQAAAEAAARSPGATGHAAAGGADVRLGPVRVPGGRLPPRHGPRSRLPGAHPLPAAPPRPDAADGPLHRPSVPPAGRADVPVGQRRRPRAAGTGRTPAGRRRARRVARARSLAGGGPAGPHRRRHGRRAGAGDAHPPRRHPDASLPRGPGVGRDRSDRPGARQRLGQPGPLGRDLVRHLPGGRLPLLPDGRAPTRLPRAAEDPGRRVRLRLPGRGPRHGRPGQPAQAARLAEPRRDRPAARRRQLQAHPPQDGAARARTPGRRGVGHRVPRSGVHRVRAARRRSPAGRPVGAPGARAAPCPHKFLPAP